jgi:hypothetical protein
VFERRGRPDLCEREQQWYTARRLDDQEGHRNPR